MLRKIIVSTFVLCALAAWSNNAQANLGCCEAPDQSHCSAGPTTMQQCAAFHPTYNWFAGLYCDATLPNQPPTCQGKSSANLPGEWDGSGPMPPANYNQQFIKNVTTVVNLPFTVFLGDIVVLKDPTAGDPSLPRNNPQSRYFHGNWVKVLHFGPANNLATLVCEDFANLQLGPLVAFMNPPPGGGDLVYEPVPNVKYTIHIDAQQLVPAVGAIGFVVASLLLALVGSIVLYRRRIAPV